MDDALTKSSAKRRNGGEKWAAIIHNPIKIDRTIFQNALETFKKTFGWLGYIFGGLAALAKQKSFSLHYELSDGRKEFITAHSFLIGNCGRLPAGLELIPHAAIDDGILDLVAVRPGGFFGWARVWSEIVLRRKGKKSSTGVGQKINTDDGEIRTLRYLRTKGAIIRTEKPIPVELDGDFFGPAIALKVDVLPGAVNVRVR